MLVTLEVLMPLRLRDVKYKHPANIYDMSVTFEVLKPLRSKELKALQIRNM